MKHVLPNKLFVFENSDKVDTTSPFNPEDLADLPTPFCCCMVATTSCGKTSLIKNLIVRQQPEFDRIVLYHYDPETTEYNDLDVEIVNEPPDKDLFKNKKKCLFIVEDINIDLLNKNQRALLNRLFGYISSHCGVSIILTAQTLTSIPVAIRRMSNFLIVWKNVDKRITHVLTATFGVDRKKIQFYFDNVLKSRYDFLMLSTYPGYPRVTKNIYEILEEDK